METVDVVATFGARHEAEAAARAAELRLGRGRVDIGTSKDERASLRGEMTDEVRSMTMGPGSVGPFTKSQSRGVVVGLMVAMPIGTVLGLLGGLLFTATDISLGARLVIGAVSGAVAGGTIGFLWGGFQPRYEGEGAQLAAERGVVVGVHGLTFDQAQDLSRHLLEFQPERIDITDGQGALVSTWSREDEHPLRGEHVATKPPGDGFEGIDPGTEGPSERR